MLYHKNNFGLVTFLEITSRTLQNLYTINHIKTFAQNTTKKYYKKIYSSIQFTATNSKWHHLLLISCPIKQCTNYMSLVVTFPLLESGAEELLV